ncbi:branched-chain amino acid ABC transporter permease [uncultured Anaerococcus sp.]|uniref:branched-chain amino acid ABC transporter permease n=1 Tax=uncultured Anaerococcus sp. TaxID=293428 RepID=UPI00288B53E8|nr:branched-chain amino acid ABC transporter permease [uncultured Anaerococcus sp.]
MSKNRKKTYLITTALVVLFFVIIQSLIGLNVLNRYWQNILVLICINIIMATSLNLTVGVLGQINLGHAGFMAIGAYSAALFLKSGLVGGFLGFTLSLIIAGVVAAIFGVLIGLPVLRLTGDYLAIVTLAFGEIIRVLIENLAFTGGAQGLAGIPTTNDFGKFYFVAAFLVAMIFTYASCRHGRAVLSIRDNELAAQACGINITKYKTFAFALSAVFAGIAGALYAQSFGVLAANIFNYNKSFDYLVMVVLGGMGSMTGAIFSSIGLTILPEILRPLAEWRMVIYALILIAVMIYRPQGLLGRKEFSIRNLLKIDKYKKGDVEGEQ